MPYRLAMAPYTYFLLRLSAGVIVITPRVGLEPTTLRLTAECSTIELSRIIRYALFRSSCSGQASHTFKTTYRSDIFSDTLCLAASAASLPRLGEAKRPISNSQLHTLLHFHLCPIYLMFSKGSGISHLEGGFTLRCLQRLSLPDLATLPWP